MAEKYDVQAIMNDLKQKQEIVPDQHDGSYELMSEIIEAYAELGDLTGIDFKDLNLVYLSAVGTWKQGIESKKNTIQESHLPAEVKNKLMADLDRIWRRAEEGLYSNNEAGASGGASIGMFGTGFYSFQGKTTPQHAQAFISMCIDILQMNNDEDMYARAEKVLTSSFQGMRAASASMVLHCLKPYTFPVLNSNMGNQNIFEVLGVQLVKKDNIETYIENSRRIKAFRDQNFTIKNYRVFDMAAWDVSNFKIKHEYGKFDSWEIIDENTARKICDKSFFQYRGSGVSQEIRWFFEAENLNNEEKKDIQLIFHGQPYHAYIIREKANLGRTRIFWDSELAASFDNYYIEGQILEFSKSSNDSYQVSFLGNATNRVWLISWNKDKWRWDRFYEKSAATKRGEAFVESWACANSNPKLGDEVFLIKLGEQPRGIIAHGIVEAESYEKEHYNPEKAAAGKLENCIDVKFDRLINYEVDPFVNQEDLLSKCAVQHWSPQDSGIEIKQEVLLTLRKLWNAAIYPHDKFGFVQMVSFLQTYAGKHYVVPEKAGNQAEYMMKMREQGQEARKKFITFGKEVASSFPDLEYISCSNWINQGQTVLEYLWIELKNNKWKDYPQSVSFSIEKLNGATSGDGYFLSVRAEARDINCKEEDYKRQLRLLDLPLGERMIYVAKLSDGKYAFLGTDKEHIKELRNHETLVKLEVVEPVNDLAEKDRDGSILAETIEAVGEIKPFYEYVMKDVKKDEDAMQFDHNMILYGPPGTGKTYNSVIYAVAICDAQSLESVQAMPYPSVLDRYRKLRDEGRIAFTTFHQSYGYEEFIEGIKPQLNTESDSIGYTIKDGVFKEFCNRAKAVKVQQNSGAPVKENPRIWGMLLGGTGMTAIKQQCFDNDEIRLGWSSIRDEDVEGEYVGDEHASRKGKRMVDDFINSMEIGDIVVIEKTFKSIDAIGVITGEYEYDEKKEDFNRRRSVQWLVKDIDQNVVEYLPAGRKQLSRFSLFAFDYFGMDTVSQIINQNTNMKVIEVDRETKPYVFIIDEINRGNISKIFGELITLMEDTKRAGASEAMEAILPYSGDSFSVPNNVYILGTMNTADRSIALMDTALRRRFDFAEMMPNSEVLESLGVGTIVVNGEELNVAKTLDIINQRIEYLFDREHTIGHAFFTKLADDPSIATLAEIFEKNVIPLLQEYFYEDYEKIQLVLGDNSKDDEFKFVLDRPIKVKDIFNGNPDIDLPEKSYVVQHEAFRKLQSYKGIGKDL